MIIYSVTVAIDREIEDDWVAWMRDVHLDDVLATGCFERASFRRVLQPDLHRGRATYTTEYLCPSMERFETYEQEHAPRLRQDVLDRYAQRFSASRMLLETVDEQTPAA